MKTGNARAFALAVLLLAVSALAGCIAPPPKPQRSILQIRELQTREFDTNDKALVMRAVLNALQDDGFVVRNAVVELGLLTASKERDLAPTTTWGGFLQGAFADRDARWAKTDSTEANATISQFGRGTRVRITFQEKILDNAGGTLSVNEIEDPVFYQNFFSRIDHSIFIQKQRI